MNSRSPSWVFANRPSPIGVAHHMGSRSPLVIVLFTAVMIVAACGSSTKTRLGSAATASGQPGDPAHSDRTIDITALDTLRFEPSSVNVKTGETVTFRVHDAGQMNHEFVLGDAKVQDEHEREMQSMTATTMANSGTSIPGMSPPAMKDEPNAVDLSAGQTRTVTWTFISPGTLIYACHYPGHYAAGMKGTITVS